MRRPIPLDRYPYLPGDPDPLVSSEPPSPEVGSPQLANLPAAQALIKVLGGSSAPIRSQQDSTSDDFVKELPPGSNMRSGNPGPIQSFENGLSSLWDFIAGAEKRIEPEGSNDNERDPSAAAQDNLSTAHGLLSRSLDDGDPPSAAPQASGAQPTPDPLACAPPASDLVLPRWGLRPPDEHMGDVPREDDPSAPPSDIRTLLHSKNLDILRELDPDHPILNQLDPARDPTVKQMFELNRAIEETRQKLGLGLERPGHHILKQEFSRTFEDLGIPRWSQDLTREFILQKEHTPAKHQALLDATRDFLKSNPDRPEHVWDFVRTQIR